MIVVDIAYDTEYLLPGSNAVLRKRGSMFLRLESCDLSMGLSCLPFISASTALEVGTASVARTRQRFVETGLGALDEAARPGAQRTLTDKQAAHLIAVACTPAPEGQAHWTLRLLADKAVTLGFAPSIARETVRQVLKKTHANPGKKNNGACPR